MRLLIWPNTWFNFPAALEHNLSSSAIFQNYCLSSIKVQSYCLKIILWAVKLSGKHFAAVIEKWLAQVYEVLIAWLKNPSSFFLCELFKEIWGCVIACTCLDNLWEACIWHFIRICINVDTVCCYTLWCRVWFVLRKEAYV